MSDLCSESGETILTINREFGSCSVQRVLSAVVPLISVVPVYVSDAGATLSSKLIRGLFSLNNEERGCRMPAAISPRASSNQAILAIALAPRGRTAVQKLGRDTQIIQATDKHVVRYLKFVLRQRSKVSESRMSLVFKGVPMEDSTLLCEYFSTPDEQRQVNWTVDVYMHKHDAVPAEDEPNSLSSLRNIPPIPGQASLRRLSWRGTGSRPQFCGSPVSAGNESESASHSTRDVNGGEEGKGTEDTEPGSVGIRTPCSISRNFRKAWRCTQRRKQGKVQRLQHELQEAHDMLDKTFVAAHESAARVRELEARSRQQQIEFSIVRRREANAQDCLRRQLDLQRGRTLSLEEEVARLKAATTCVSKKRMRQLEAQVQRLQCRPAAQGALEYCDRAIAQGQALSDAGRAVLTSLRSSIARLTLSVNDAFERLDQREANEEENCTQCVVCFDAVRDIVFTPCGHVVACHQCAQQLPKCPIGRRAKRRA
eukprot:INCI7661.11.p1 GENE.INCI7661.11~~INCI7661.11.p1  ORF type:complete len:484 (-),score=74.92 INCI7661.11:3081-4532(-)